ncbi:pyridoxamine 5'-phosphate oxidase family protein [Amycolatopsis nigrescens]|uniref:pyridoxamine 5'-phosphate oxidase family protein n=1 Tax=Amycolatopsis nigrescens TaxID=381445 RepID=UPI000367DBBE|nr:pyridoxamine 5'-phosphate oxidase family protein [Amycolatopsis nigrescens]
MTPGFHPGELHVQQRAGERERAQLVGRMVDRELSPGIRELLAGMRTIAIATIDHDGNRWTTLCAGTPGFLAGEARRLRIGSPPPVTDPARPRAGGLIGAIGIDMAHRRRVRINGTAEAVTDDEVVIAVREAYGNCPRYIDPTANHLRDHSAQRRYRPAAVLSPRQRRLIEAAPVFFIGSAHPRFGADASHRGGPPGFVTVHSGTEISFPDYRGNGLFNTLGNLADHPSVGLVFADPADTMLQVTGRAAIHWHPRSDTGEPSRTVSVHITKVVESNAPKP